MNHRLLIVLLILALDVASALAVVYVRHDSRNLSVELGALEARHDAAVAEWSRLQLEQAWLADAGQIESTAREKLRMQAPDRVHILVTER